MSALRGGAAGRGRGDGDPRPSAEHPVAAPLAVPGSLGVLGGTFDPIHIGHLAVAEEVREVLGLERVLFVPASVPPHKPGRPISPVEDRAAMVALAIADNPAFELSRVELDRPGPSYSVETVEELLRQGRVTPVRNDATPVGIPVDGRDRAATSAIFLILSAEAAAQLATWHEPTRLLSLCRLAVVPRAGVRLPEGWAAAEFPGFEDRFVMLDGPDLAISGSAIRERVRSGRSIRYLVPDAVRAYIGDHGLYRGADAAAASPAARPTGSMPA